jgi:hypothetical protein
VDVVLCYSPDRLARKFAYQALLIEEFARAGTRVEFVKGPRGDSPEDQLLVQFQGMFAEYEKAQILERYRRGKAHRAHSGSVNVLSGARSITGTCVTVTTAYAGQAVFGKTMAVNESPGLNRRARLQGREQPARSRPWTAPERSGCASRCRPPSPRRPLRDPALIRHLVVLGVNPSGVGSGVPGW